MLINKMKIKKNPQKKRKLKAEIKYIIFKIGQLGK